MPPPSPEDRAKAIAAATAASWADVAQEVEDVEVLLHALRGQYEQYFMGIEKRPPVWAHDQFKKRLTGVEDGAGPELRPVLPDPVPSGDGPHLRAASGARTMQEIEDGTYKRGPVQGPAAPEEQARDEGRACGSAGEEEGRGGEGGRARVARCSSAEPQIHIAGTASAGSALRESLRGVYRAYVEAKRRCNEDTTRLSFDAVVASLKRQVPELLERHNVRVTWSTGSS
jgi:hypothetical protein